MAEASASAKAGADLAAPVELLEAVLAASKARASREPRAAPRNGMGLEGAHGTGARSSHLGPSKKSKKGARLKCAQNGMKKQMCLKPVLVVLVPDTKGNPPAMCTELKTKHQMVLWLFGNGVSDFNFFGCNS